MVRVDPAVKFLVLETASPLLTETQARFTPNIRYIEMDEIAETTTWTPNDPIFASQDNLVEMGAVDAWQNEIGSRSVSICNIDTGFDYRHGDLADGYLGGYDFYDDDANPLNTVSGTHGMMMIGISAATINNGRNISGVANVSFYGLKTNSDSSGGGVDAAAAASSMSWCANQSARVFSMSFGSQTEHTDWNTSLQFAFYHRNAVLVASAGNSLNSPILFPGRHPISLTVTCVTASNVVCGNPFPSMSRGPALDISAPGNNVWKLDSGNRTTVPTGGATSEAAAHVAGAAAILISHQPSLVNQVVKDLLEETATDIAVYGSGRDDDSGWGMVNVGAALDELLPDWLPTCRFVLPLKTTTLSGVANISAYAYSPGNNIAYVNLTVDSTFIGGMTHHTSDIVNDAYYLGNDTYYRGFDTTTLTDGAHTFEVKCRESDGGERAITRTYTVDN
ncbi:MAG TPA: S8 family serine peptidase [Candidatus Thermoplasmatota archaeon]|nr:S8 family serine peptidase [Candidatus Thermoplasmatota archaeon]